MPSASPLSLADRDHPGTGGVGCAALHHQPPSLTPIPAYAHPATMAPGSMVHGGRVGPGADHAWPFHVRATELLTARGSWRRPCDLSSWGSCCTLSVQRGWPASLWNRDSLSAQCPDWHPSIFPRHLVFGTRRRQRGPRGRFGRPIRPGGSCCGLAVPTAHSALPKRSPPRRSTLTHFAQIYPPSKFAARAASGA
jgi:hypothetical protein